MPERVKKSKATRTLTRRSRTTRLSPRTKKQIDSLPKHAQEIYKEAHANALQQAHKVAWAAVKKKYKKDGTEWVKN